MRPSKGLVGLLDSAPSGSDFKCEVLAGLTHPDKRLPAKFLYDRRGSELFDQITTLEEYYLTRTEIWILHQYGEEIVSLMGEKTALIELGSGSGIKVRALIDRMPNAASYSPVDISLSHLRQSADVLAARYPDLKIVPVCADYTQPFPLPEIDGAKKRVILFFGSTIGNFEPEVAGNFLKKMRGLLRPGDGLLVGVDLKKDPAILHAAYNDARGITSLFNLNVLRRINDELGADFELARFEHMAFYNEPKGRVEMHLRSLCDQTITINGIPIQFAHGETIHTENSYKYGVGEFQSLCRQSGFTPIKVWFDPQRWFGVHYFQAGE